MTKSAALHPKTIRINFDRAADMASYDIVIGRGLLAHAAALICERLGPRRCVIVSDSNVAPLYREKLEASLRAGGHEVLAGLVFPAGEASKNFTQLQSLLNGMLGAGVDRQSLVIALGGGVVGDIAGLSAALVMRGVDCVQVPTSLLAQVDSSVGGKTGIDTPHGKNTVGVFFQPRLVIADVDVLQTLSMRERAAGYAEVVKYGLIKDAAFFRWCEANGRKVVEGDAEAQIYAVGISCEAKAGVVESDVREAGPRALLNLGHTFGHALEAATGFGPELVHGEAVAIGTIMAFRLSVRLGYATEKDFDSVKAHFSAVGLPVSPPKRRYAIDALMDLMAKDKKALAGNIALILPHGIGSALAHNDIDPREIRALWEEVFKWP